MTTQPSTEANNGGEPLRLNVNELSSVVAGSLAVEMVTESPGMYDANLQIAKANGFRRGALVTLQALDSLGLLGGALDARKFMHEVYRLTDAGHVKANVDEQGES